MLSSGKKCNFFCFLFLRSGAASNGSSCTSWLQVRIIFLWWETSLARFEFSTRISQSPCFSFILFYVSIFHFYFIIYIYKTSFFYFCFFALFLFRRSVGKTSGGTFLLFPSEAEHRKIAENVLRKTWQAFLFYILFFLRRWMEDVQQNLTCVIFWPGGWNTGKIYNQTMKRREKRKVPLPRLVFLFAASKWFRADFSFHCFHGGLNV